MAWARRFWSVVGGIDVTAGYFSDGLRNELTVAQQAFSARKVYKDLEIILPGSDDFICYARLRLFIVFPYLSRERPNPINLFW